MVMSSDFYGRYGPWAVLAGASEGIGACMARRLAAEGINLILIGLGTEELDGLKREIGQAHPSCEVRVMAADLTKPANLQAIKSLAADVEVGFFAYIAGSADYYRDMVDDTLDHVMFLIQLNVTSNVELVHHFAGRMKQRGRGGVMLIGSTCAYAGVPSLAIYSAVKAFILTLSEAMWGELRAHGVDLIGYNLDPVATPASLRNYPGQSWRARLPDQVAEYGLAHMRDGPVVYDGKSGETARMLGSMPRAEAIDYLIKVASQAMGEEAAKA
jgi:short-subunit dehydrogenase